MESMDLKSLDAEGRVLTLDFGLFVLINVYCPNDGSTEEDTTRFDYKMAFHRLLEARVRRLIKEGREVILLGDINACAALIDHCEGDIILRRGVAQGFDGDREQYFWVENGARQWLKDILEGEKKCLVDVVRRYHPDRQGMFTCEWNWLSFVRISSMPTGWNTKISARASNYGTRIDYILVTPGLMPWIKGADIEPDIKGSDHCPVWIELHEEIEINSNEGIMKKKLRDVMFCNASGEVKENQRDPPRLATRFWDEYSGKQRLLASFFTAAPIKGKVKAKESIASGLTPCRPLNEPPTLSAIDGSPISSPSLHTSLEPSPSLEVPSSSIPSSNESKKRKTPPPTSFSTSSSSSSVSSTQSKKQKKEGKRPGQSKLSNFFVAPSTGKGKAKAKSMVDPVPPSTFKSDLGKAMSADNVADTRSDTTNVVDLTADGEGVYDVVGDDGTLRLSLSQKSSSSSSNSASSSQAWKSLLTPPEPPRCIVHNEVAKELKVNKPGVNKGRGFWVCSRQVLCFSAISKTGIHLLFFQASGSRI